MKSLNYGPWTISNVLIFISAIFTLLTFIPSLGIYKFGMNDVFYSYGIYHIWLIQMFTSQFLHGGVLHLLMNSVFILYFWNALEVIIWKNRFVYLFIWNALFLGLVITFFWSGNTVGISGFAMAVLACYTLQLRSLKHPEWAGWLTALILNVAIGLSPGISFLWHFGGAIFWMVFWFLVIKKK